MKRRLEILQPCDFDARSAEPSATPGAVFCRGCGHDVFDLSKMSRAEALAFFDSGQPDYCVFFESDANDRIIFKDGVGDIVGRLAHDARPMITVASLLLAACGSAETEDGPAGPADSVVPSASASAAPVAAVPTMASVTQATAATSSSVELPCKAVASASASASARARPSSTQQTNNQRGPKTTTGVALRLESECYCDKNDPLCGCLH
ncbi:MAG: hypothetical protein U0271_21745 [Polyangiaceae bacterium]